MVTGIEFSMMSLVLDRVASECCELAKDALDVCINRQSFNELSDNLLSISRYFKALVGRDQREGLISSGSGLPITEKALEMLQKELSFAKELTARVRGSSQFYNLLHCRAVARDLQRSIRGIGEALRGLQLAVVEVALEMHEGIDQLSERMANSSVVASESMVELVNRLEQGAESFIRDRTIANELLLDIARSIGIPHDPRAIGRELDSFRKEKDDAASRKEHQEEKQLERIIALLSMADSDSAYSQHQSKDEYKAIKESIEKTPSKSVFLDPLKSFKCPLTNKPMLDPVDYGDQTYEREAILAELPVNPPPSLRPNKSLRNTIHEWRKRRDVARILIAKLELQPSLPTPTTGSSSFNTIENALDDLALLCKESFVNQDWITFEGLPPLLIALISLNNPTLSEKSLHALLLLAKDNDHNQDVIIDANGVLAAASCLLRKINVARAAVHLLEELITHKESARTKLEEESQFFHGLVVRSFDEEDEEIARISQKILNQLSCKDQNVVIMARLNWCGPLVDRIIKGSTETKLELVNALAGLQLNSNSYMMMKEAVPAVVDMLSSTLKAKVSALNALQNLSRCAELQPCIGQSGVVGILLGILGKRENQLTEVKELVLAILENLCSSGEAMEFLLDTSGTPIEPEKLVSVLISQLNLSRLSSNIPYCAMNTLRGLLSIDKPHAEQIRLSLRKLEVINPILLHMQSARSESFRSRNSAVHLLSCIFTEEEKEKEEEEEEEEEESGLLTQYILHSTQDLVMPLITLISLPSSEAAGVQAAAANVLSILPFRNEVFRRYLLGSATLVTESLQSMLFSEEPATVEASLRVLLKLSDRSDIDMQLRLANSGREGSVFPLLNRVLKLGSTVAKARAAKVLGNLSSSTFLLMERRVTIGPCLFQRLRRGVWCSIHRGSCGPHTTLCIAMAQAIPPLVEILHHPHPNVVVAGFDALDTLLVEETTLEAALEAIHRAGAHKAVSKLLGTASPPSPPECRSRALKLLDLMTLKAAPKIRQSYANLGRLPQTTT